MNVQTMESCLEPSGVDPHAISALNITFLAFHEVDRSLSFFSSFSMFFYMLYGRFFMLFSRLYRMIWAWVSCYDDFLYLRQQNMVIVSRVLVSDVKTPCPCFWLSGCLCNHEPAYATSFGFMCLATKNHFPANIMLQLSG